MNSIIEDQSWAAYEIFVLTAKPSNAEGSSKASILNFDLSLHLHLYSVMQAAIALASLHVCLGLSEPSLLENMKRKSPALAEWIYTVKIILNSLSQLYNTRSYFFNSLLAHLT